MWLEVPEVLCYVTGLSYTLGQLHIDGDVVPTFASSAGSLQLLWSSAGLLHSWPSLLQRLPWKAKKRVISVRLYVADKWIFHHDNAPCNTALSFTEFFTSKGIHIVSQPPIHLMSAPVTFSFFLNLKMSSKDVILGL